MLKEILKNAKSFICEHTFCFGGTTTIRPCYFYHGRRKRGVTVIRGVTVGRLMSLSLCTSVSICGIVAPKRIDRFPRDFIHLKAR